MPGFNIPDAHQMWMKRRGFIATGGAVALSGCLVSGQSDPIRAKVDLHSHLYHDGSEFPDEEDHTVDTQQLLAAYEAYGFDVIAGTDHHHEANRDIPGRPDSDQVIDYSRLDFDGIVLDGVELSAGPHVNLIRSESEEIRQINHPRGASPEEIQGLADRIGAELVEVTSRGHRLTQYPTPTDVLTRLEGLKPTMTTDAHSVEELQEHHGSHLIVEVDGLTGDGVIRALRRGDYSLASHRW